MRLRPKYRRLLDKFLVVAVLLISAALSMNFAFIAVWSLATLALPDRFSIEVGEAWIALISFLACLQTCLWLTRSFSVLFGGEYHGS